MRWGWFLAWSVAAQLSAQDGVFWRITRDASPDTSYLLGTVHSADRRAFTHAALPLALLPRLDAVVGEVDIAEMRLDPSALASFQLPKGTYLDDLYSRKEYARVRSVLLKELGPLFYVANHMKPFFVIGVMSDSIMRQDSAHVLDEYLQIRARALGKKVAGLERVSDQTTAIDHIPLKEQASMLLDMVDHDLHRDQLEALMNAYASGDLDAILRISNEADAPGDHMDEALLDERNPGMAAAMDTMMRNGKHCLFAVGAMHLPGAGGAIERLRALGYTLSSLR